MKGFNSDKQVALYDCPIPTKNSVIPQKRKHIEEEQGTVPIQTSRREQKSAAIINKAFLTIHTSEIQYMFSNGSPKMIPRLGGILCDAVRTSRQWNMERTLGDETTGCLTIMIPKNPTQDHSVTLWIDPEKASRIIRDFQLKLIQ